MKEIKTSISIFFMEIIRQSWLKKIREEFEVHPICALLGPRQCGKTTLAQHMRHQTKAPIHFFDCENPSHLARLENPLLTLEELKGLIIIDEVQRRPDLFPILRVLVDYQKEQRYLVTGSSSRDLIHQSSESLAGRIGYHNITPFTLDEVEDWRKLWKRGGFPRAYLASSDRISYRWREEYIKTFIERDLNQLGFTVPPTLIGKIWRMLAHLHGQILTLSDLSSSLQLDPRTIRRYISILEGTFMIRLLRPWHTNSGKREIKSPKIYIRDTGILHQLCSLKNEDIENHPRVGASFEGFVIEQLIHFFGSEDQCYFWGTHNKAEVDLLLMQPGKRLGFEIKLTDSPRITKSMLIALEDLNLDHLYIVCPIEENFPLHKKISCLALRNLQALSF